ncbi:TetR/AcrR family transcriptional regulator [Mesoterricola silvestris]|nr:TetR/AcrR family transcriptional regulator [Mesoterricola silvestris]
MDPRTLLDAALKVFGREGLEGASLRAIAREAGCDPSLIYYHFENKEAMFTALLEERIPPLVRDLRRLANPGDPRSTAEKLWTALRSFHHHLHDSAGFRAMVRGQIVRGAETLPDQLAVRMRPAQLAVLTILRRGQRRGELRPDLNPFLMGLFLIRMEAEILDLVPVFSERLAGIPAPEAIAWAERTWFDVFWRGVAVHPLEPLPFLENL